MAVPKMEWVRRVDRARRDQARARARFHGVIRQANAAGVSLRDLEVAAGLSKSQLARIVNEGRGR
jgi:hypothetical protein